MGKLTKDQMILARDILIDLTYVMNTKEIAYELWYYYNSMVNIIAGNRNMSEKLAKKLLNLNGTLKENKNFILLKK